MLQCTTMHLHFRRRQLWPELNAALVWLNVEISHVCCRPGMERLNPVRSPKSSPTNPLPPCIGIVYLDDPTEVRAPEPRRSSASTPSVEIFFSPVDQRVSSPRPAKCSFAGNVGADHGVGHVTREARFGGRYTPNHEQPNEALVYQKLLRQTKLLTFQL